MSDIEVIYQGSKVDTITVTVLAIWNYGNSVLNYSEVSQADPLKIIFHQDFLDFQLKSTTNSTNLVNLKKLDSKTIQIEFDYLGKNDGFTLNIVHSAPSGRQITVDGTIKGYSKPIKVSHTKLDIPFFPSSYPFNKVKITPMALGSATIIVGFAMMLAAYFLPFQQEIKMGQSDKIFGIVVGLSYLLMGSLIFFTSRRRVPKKLSMDIE